ncbi:MAG: HEAT repeat domain-containing protein [Desulfobulbaceae bacterium]|nr:HEAT repeat domain-containing protein [Desulfobulbaceae bacterium]
MFEGRKIKKLLEKYTAAEAPQDQQHIFSELHKFGEAAVQHTIDAFQRRRLSSHKAQSLLEKLCGDSCLPILVPLIGDPYDEVRRVVKELLIKRWPKKASPLLVEHLACADIYERNNTIELLIHFKDPACESTLVDMFNSGDLELKRNIIKVLGRMAGRAGKKLIISALNDESWQVRLSAVKCLGKLKEPESVEPLIEKLTEKDPRIKMLAIDALSEIADKRATRPMLELLKDQDLVIRQKATECLIEIADARAVPEIIELLKTGDVNVRRCAIEIFRQMKDPSTCVALMNAIKDSDWWVRQIATDSLISLKGDNIVKAFVGLALDQDENIRRCVVEFFNNVSDPAAFDSLLTLLDDQDWWVREKAITALGKLKDKRAVKRLAAMEDDPEVNLVVPGALAEIGGEEIIPALKTFLGSDNKRLKIETILAIAREKIQGLVADLKLCLADPDEEVRNETIEALKTITGMVFTAAPGKPAPARNKITAGSTVTEAMLVLDLCNSTDITTRYGDTFAMKLIQKLSSVVNPLAQREEYCFMKGTGDGYLITFPKAINAVCFASDVLENVKKLNNKVEESEWINLRFAINIGEAKVDENGDRLGAAVNMTFRVEGVKPENLIPAENGMTQEEMPRDNRILVTEHVMKEIQNADGFQNRLIGFFELKGITGLHRIFQLTKKT